MGFFERFMNTKYDQSEIEEQNDAMREAKRQATAESEEIKRAANQAALDQDNAAKLVEQARQDHLDRVNEAHSQISSKPSALTQENVKEELAEGGVQVIDAVETPVSSESAAASIAGNVEPVEHAPESPEKAEPAA